MKIENLTKIIIVLGIIVLFFFPEPENNFFLYIGTGLLLAIVILFLIKRKS